MTNRTLKWTFTVSGVAALGLAFLAGRAIAGGIPATGAMTYAGVLESSAGTPLSGTGHAIVFALWDNAQTGAGTSRCNVQSPGPGYDLGTSGRFSIALPDTCVTAVQTYPDLWVELTVDGVGLPRTKLGAVPYAVESGHAVSADRATTATSATTATNATTAATANAAGGALDTRIRALENASPGRSTFLAIHTTGTSIATGTQPTIVFDNEVFDTDGEYNASTGAFTAKSAGYYDIGCNIIFNRPAGAAPFYMEAGIFLNGTRRDVAAGNGDGYVQSNRARSLFRLAAGDVVTCRAYQNSGAVVSLINQRPEEAASSFSAIRLAP